MTKSHRAGSTGSDEHSAEERSLANSLALEGQAPAYSAALGGWPELADERLQQSAVRGTALLVARSLALQALALGATLVLARLLTPAEYGAFAVAAVVQQAGRGLVEVGLPASLIQRRQPPSPAEQHTVTAVTLALALTLAAAVALVAFIGLPALGAQSTVAELAAITCLSLPLLALQVIPAVLLERGLRFGRLLLVETVGALAFYGFALATAAAGLGAYSLAGAVPTSALAALLAFQVVQPWNRGLSLDLGRIRSLIGFGTQTGAAYLVGTGRDLGLVGGLAALGGQALAGFYDMSRRVLSLPLALMHALLRVAFPALSRAPADRRTGQAVKGAGVAVLAAGLPMALIAGSAENLVDFLFGERWVPAADIIVTASAGILLFISAGTMLNRLLLAGGDARSPLTAEVAHALVTVIAALLLVPDLGASGAGIAIGAGYAVNTVVLLIFAPSDARGCLGPVLRGMAIAFGAAAGGHLIAADAGTAIPLITGLAATAGLWALLAVVVCRTETLELVRLVRRHIVPAQMRGK